MKEPVYVTRPSLPPLEEFTEYLRKIWDSRVITNNGPLHVQFEQALAEFLGVKYISLFSNGTLALVTALQTLRITGEVITTPFSFVATTHALWWNNIKPVFADIEPDHLNLDPAKAEAAITPQTTAIMPVHVYGNPARVEEFQRIAETYNLRLIYDAAHAFGVRINNVPLLSFGDLSVLSFHATKSFNTIEGGAIVCHDEQTKRRIDLLKNFGFVDETIVVEPGINAKMNELQSAYGLLQLKYVKQNTEGRRLIAGEYRKRLRGIPGIRFMDDIEGTDHAYSYFPVLIDGNLFSKTREEVYTLLRKNNIYSRRYFYPLISNFPSYSGLPSSNPERLPVATKAAEQVLCLPIYPDLDPGIVRQICDIILG
jgi:dTDP-4-amino-4,6-dideoxygalactose transaminase